MIVIIDINTILSENDRSSKTKELNLERQISATKKSRFPSVKRAMLNKVSKPEMQDRPRRNGSLATLMGGM